MSADSSAAAGRDAWSALPREPATRTAAKGVGQGTGDTASAADAAVMASGTVSVTPSELNTVTHSYTKNAESDSCTIAPLAPGQRGKACGQLPVEVHL